MKFLIVLGNQSIDTYDYGEKGIEPRFIEGSPSYPISLGNASADMRRYMEDLTNELNMDSTSDLEFDILEGSDRSLNEMIEAFIQEHIRKVYTLKDTLKTIIQKLARDDSLMIASYGINYGGKSYILEGQNLQEGEFDLLAYTIHSGDVMQLMEL